MRIKKIISQHEDEFNAVYECEHCGHTKEGNGYDDISFYDNVIPKMVCEKCGKNTSGGYRPMVAKYPNWYL